MDRLSAAQGRFVRIGRRSAAGAQPGPLGATSVIARGRPIVRKLEELAAASMSVGWECVQAAYESATQPFPRLDIEGLEPSLGIAGERPRGSPDWERFDSAWQRVRRELGANDLIGVGLALLDFAQACRITADRFAVREPVAGG